MMLLFRISVKLSVEPLILAIVRWSEVIVSGSLKKISG